MQIKIYIGSFLVVLNEYEDVVGRYEREDHLDEWSLLKSGRKKTLALLSPNFDSEKERLEIIVWIKVDWITSIKRCLI